MEHKIDVDKLPIAKIIEIDANLAYNPVKLCLEAFESIEHLDLLMLANNIRNPYKELKPGRIIAVPHLMFSKSETQSPTDAKVPALKLKHAKINNNQITF